MLKCAALKCSLLLLVVLCLTISSFAQSDNIKVIDLGFIASADAVANAPQGGYIMVGNASGLIMENDVTYLVRLNAVGDSVWTRKIALEESVVGVDAVTTADNHILSVANVSPYGKKEILLLVYTDKGKKVFHNKVAVDAGSQVKAMQLLSDGNLILGCECNNDLLLAKIDGTGKVLWSKRLDTGVNEGIEYVFETKDKGFFLCGHTVKKGEKGKPYFAKTDAKGNKEWDNFGKGAPGRIGFGYAGIQDAEGNFLFVGTNTQPNGDRQILVEKVDAKGSVLWSKSFGGTKDEIGRFAMDAGNGQYLIAASQDSDKGSCPYLLALNGEGMRLLGRSMPKAGYTVAPYGFCAKDKMLAMVGAYGNPDNLNLAAFLKKTNVETFLKRASMRADRRKAMEKRRSRRPARARRR